MGVLAKVGLGVAKVGSWTVLSFDRAERHQLNEWSGEVLQLRVRHDKHALWTVDIEVRGQPDGQGFRHCGSRVWEDPHSAPSDAGSADLYRCIARLVDGSQTLDRLIAACIERSASPRSGRRTGPPPALNDLELAQLAVDYETVIQGGHRSVYAALRANPRWSSMTERSLRRQVERCRINRFLGYTEPGRGSGAATPLARRVLATGVSSELANQGALDRLALSREHDELYGDQVVPTFERMSDEEAVEASERWFAEMTAIDGGPMP